jgi:hypothetical protein
VLAHSLLVVTFKALNSHIHRSPCTLCHLSASAFTSCNLCDIAHHLHSINAASYPMPSEEFIDSLNNWSEVVVDHLYGVDPVFACEAVRELDSIDHRFPNALRTPSAPATSQLFPGFNTPASRPPSGPPPVFSTPGQVPHNAWTPMRTGGSTPNHGIRGGPGKRGVVMHFEFFLLKSSNRHSSSLVVPMRSQ